MDSLTGVRATENLIGNRPKNTLTRSLSPKNKVGRTSSIPEGQKPSYSRPIESFYPKNEISDSSTSVSKSFGISHKFTRQNINRFYEDKTLDKATKLKNKDLHLAREARNIKKLLEDKYNMIASLENGKELETIKQSRIKRIFIEHQELEQRLELAAITIQRFIRGYITRVHLNKKFLEMEKQKLASYLNLLENQIKSYWSNMGEIAHTAAQSIQKKVRGMIVRKIYKPSLELKNNERRSRENLLGMKIQCFYKRYSASVVLELMKEENLKLQKLQIISERLRFMRVKNFWEKNRFK